MYSFFQGYYFCVKQYALECSRIPMGQSVNSQVMALQAKPVLLRVRFCFGRGSNLWDRVGISGAVSSGELCSLLLEKQNSGEPFGATCPLWPAAQADLECSERGWEVWQEDDSCPSLESKTEQGGEEQEQFCQR